MNAAALSAIGRFYLALLCWLAAAAAAAQTPPSPGGAPAVPEQPTLGSVFTPDLLRALPVANNPLAIFETIQLESIANRVSTGGLDVTATEVGGLLNSWTQTQYRIGDVAITDPRTGGTPLLLPPLPAWARVTAATGAMTADDSAAAVSLVLDPARPGTAWNGTFEASASGGALAAGVNGPVPPIARLDAWQHADVAAGGPVSSRLGLVAGGSYRGFSYVPGAAIDATDDRSVSGFAHAVFAAGPRDEVRVFGLVQHVTTAALTDTAVHVQSTWERRAAPAPWRAFAGYTALARTAPLPSTVSLDTLVSDPVPAAIDSGAGLTRRWTAGVRIDSPKESLWPSIGADLDRASLRADPTGVQTIEEFVNGLPARLWTIRSAAASDSRHLTTVAVHANEHLIAGPVAIDAGLRLESIDAAAERSSSGIQWTTWLPHAAAQWQATRIADLRLIASYRRSAYQLPLNVIAIGDDAAPVADVAAWNGRTIGPLVARVGPGSGGDPAFAQIDPQLRRPTTDELVLAVRARPARGFELELARITKRQRPLLDLVDTGVLASEYTPVQVPDPSFEPGSPVGAPTVTAFSRPAGSYGRDRYLLTNRAADPVDSWALELIGRVTSGRLTLVGGIALTEAHGAAAAVGFLPTENDQDVVGSVLVDPNADTQARGQLFQDRSHVAKIAGIYRLPWRIDLGAILRYQDGQPFSRVVVAPALTQGPTLVRSYANGGSAFTFTGTLDVRVQQSFIAGRSTIAVIADVINAPNLGNEVTEYVVTGPAFRTPTALQPPRTLVVGLRVGF